MNHSVLHSGLSDTAALNSHNWAWASRPWPGRGTIQDTQHQVRPCRKAREYSLERKHPTSGSGTGSPNPGLVTLLANSESQKHFLSINRGVTVERTNCNRALFVAIWGCFLSRIMNSCLLNLSVS